MLSQAGITKIFVSEFQRTHQMAAPLAARLSLTPERSLSKDVPGLVKQLATYKDDVVLVVGHNTSVPAVIAEFGGPKVAIPDTDYGNLFMFVPATRTLTQASRSLVVTSLGRSELVVALLCDSARWAQAFATRAPGNCSARHSTVASPFGPSLPTVIAARDSDRPTASWREWAFRAWQRTAGDGLRLVQRSGGRRPRSTVLGRAERGTVRRDALGLVGGRRGAEVFVRPDMAALGDDISRDARVAIRCCARRSSI